MELPYLLAAGLLFFCLLKIAIVDVRTFRIPDALSLGLIAGGLAFAAWRSVHASATEPPAPFAGHLLGAGAGYLSLALVGEVFFRWRGTEGLGLGDAKLFGASGAWLGWQALPFVLLLASLSGLVQALVTGRSRAPNRRFAFGPHLAGSFWLIWLFGAPGLPPIWR
ncbi:MAG: prepilin peptidase [Rhizobiaceae bacterium]|nr:prepilin peptidase [Rhizobiaceae bacterium]